MIRRILLCCSALLLLLVWNSHGLAQAWHPMPAGQVSLFKLWEGIGLDSALFGMRIDSVALEGQDSAFYLYRITRLVTGNEYDCNGSLIPYGSHATNRDHYLGQKMLRSPNGHCKFVFSTPDSFMLHGWAAPGDTWLWSPGDLAQVDSIVYRPVLGVMDSLKYISLQSGPTVILSREHGLVRIHNLIPYQPLYGFGTIQVEFELWGIPTAGLGGRIPSYAEIGQMDVGDQLGFLHNSYNAGYGSVSRRVNCTIASQVPGSRFQYAATCDSLVVTNLNGQSTDSSYHPAGMQTLAIDSLLAPDLTLLPCDDGPNDGSGTLQMGTYLIAGSAGRLRMHHRTQLYNWDPCANAYLVNPNYISQKVYATGLMQTQQQFMSPNSVSSYNLYCYQKGAETWGSCLDLGTLIAVEPVTGPEFEIAPNPASSVLRVNLREGPGMATLHLLDLQGRVVLSMPWEGNPASIPVSHLPMGMYLLQVYDADRGIRSQRVVIAR